MTDEKKSKTLAATCKGELSNMRLIFTELSSKISGYLVGFSYGFIWFGSILLGFYFLYVPLLLLLPFSRSRYRQLTDTLFSSWEAFNVVSRSPQPRLYIITSLTDSPPINLRSQDCPHRRQFNLRKCSYRRQSSYQVAGRHSQRES